MISITDKSRSGMSLLGDESRNSSTVSSLVLHSFLLCGPASPQSGNTAVGGLGSLTSWQPEEKDSSPGPSAWKTHRELDYLGWIIWSTPGQSPHSTEMHPVGGVCLLCGSAARHRWRVIGQIEQQ